ncbi:mannitol-1-phosphate 5-dehydrogenase [Microbacterium sp. zg.Y1090]|uniref:mannitol-1-phosphate 5-dehydrogenase n=1 Tax=Microbacterium TaxID=33882 RepID=UPI00214D03DA|nr:MULTISPECIES: mannitol-1-phosphate 5-dehydrogenase [unclassified Microbacterium]MCR2813641.1 mannitol-1-phosphate 5-dehydrogenase [Microbacterium sp. zg.Y1084]MCR2818026.1 mannitol-1-phosphate 5-dehydrogenase [Microbacterium sp. zg.Y1090]MDL5488131.1 mannitol-1-phosphate 5-dehydrogenase [Microbacterium sp. zg-Y1211]WIM27815.1 mannitol-1-phosphate 5-dehydrogenase [Microbacterium sp. zg-Y1090]
MKAVHFGAGNIGRGFVGLLLHEGGYELVFSDVAGDLVDAINAADSYTVHEVGEGGVDKVVTGFRAVNSQTDPQKVVDEIATADIVTTAVGPTVLRFVAPHIVAGLGTRDPALPPLIVMACENAINATDLLREEMRAQAGDAWDAIAGRAVFANTAVDRIVPGQPAGGGVDVTVEPFFEWAIEAPPFQGDLPSIPGAHFVGDLAPYIERKLFTVNTGHAATAYFGARAGVDTIAAALSDSVIIAAVARALEETSALLAAKHGLDADDLTDYRETILRRFANPALPDTVWRVGRQPLRKLSRHERFIGPAAEAAERGLSVDALLAAVGAALEFDDAEDPQSVDLQRLLREQDAATFTASVTGLEPDHPLFFRVQQLVQARQRALS